MDRIFCYENPLLRIFIRIDNFFFSFLVLYSFGQININDYKVFRESQISCKY